MSNSPVPGLPPLPLVPENSDEYWLFIARLWAARSIDPHLRSGCVLASGERQLIAACDAPPPNSPESRARRTDARQRELHLMSAPEAAVAMAARFGVSLAGSSAYCWPLPPIARDMRLLVTAGCRRIITPDGVPIPRRFDDDWEAAQMIAGAAGVSFLSIPITDLP